MIEVTLSKTESRLARYVGRVRNQMSLETKTNLRRDPNQTDEEMNIEAVGAELAVAKTFNVYPDLSPTQGKLPEWDMTWNGKNIEVKRNHVLKGDLLVPALNEKLLYVLVVGHLPKFNIVGYLEGSSIPALGDWVDLTYGPCWRVLPDLLRSVENLLSRAGKK